MKLTHPSSKHSIDVDPGHVDPYLSQGWREPSAASVEAPAGNASLSDWQEFAKSKGYTEDDLDGRSRDDLREALS